MNLQNEHLVLADGSQRFALVTADVLGFPPPVKRAVVKRLGDDGWTSKQLMLLPSHSHTSIEMMQINPDNTFVIPQLGLFKRELYELTVDNLVRVVREAAARMEPVRVGTAQRRLPGWNANRRRSGGVTDDNLTVTRVDRDDGKPLAVLVSFTAHPTFMAAEDMLFSGGWPGHLQRTTEALLGGGVTVMYYNGAEGDQRPVARPDSGGSRWERAEQYGHELGLIARELVGRIETAADVAFDYHLQPIRMPPRGPHPDFMRTGGAEYGLSPEIMDRLLSATIPAETTSGILRLGELLIVGVPGELAASLGLKIKREAALLTSATMPTIGGLANEWVSYILPLDDYRRGGYEASTSFYGDRCGPVIVEGVLEGIRRLADE